MKCPDCGMENIPGADDCMGCSSPLANADNLTPKKGMAKRIIEGMVADLFPKKAASVNPSDTLDKAVAAMRKEKIGCVLAVENGEFKGMVSERELILKVPETVDLARTPVSAVLWRGSTCLKDDDQLADVFHHMTVSGHLHVPIRFKDGSFGIVSARDLLRYLCK